MANDNNETRECNENESLNKTEDSSHNEAEALCETEEDKDSQESSGKKSETVNNGEGKTTKSLPNDLVADLCISSSSPTKHLGRSPGSSNNNGYGDYTNIRATTGFKKYQTEATTENSTSSSNITGTPIQASQPSQAPVQNSSSSFSFKHFLNSSSAVTAPSTTVTSLDPMIGIADSTSGNNLGNAINISNNLQTSTGARPKVPQSASVCGQISALASGTNLTNSGNKISKDSTASKMKRSPRFSSFDSQASLAEFAGNTNEFQTSSHISNYNVQRYNSTADNEENCDDYFNTNSFSPRAPVSSSTNKTVDYGSCQYLPRSFSNYDLPSGTPRRRLGYSPTSRPNRLALNYNTSPYLSNSSTDFNLPSTSAAAASAAAATAAAASSSSSSSIRQPGNNLNELPHGAAVLPDFVQDHWLDSWYGHDTLLNSPSNSPISDFVEEPNLTPSIGLPNTSASVQSSIKRENLSTDCNSSGNNVILGSSIAMSGTSGIIAPGSVNVLNDSSVSSTMLPDFLSDGPIIHSSQRIADIAVGLPSNSIGSPDESAMVTQLSRVLSDNDRLQQELAELRLALTEQTRRANDLERLLQENEKKEKSTSQEKQTQSEAPEESLVSKLQNQIIKMRNEMDRLRRENELLIEGGAVGGFEGTSNNASTTSNTRQPRPSRSQSLSRDLRLAASTAESHLRQLLAGVENLRQIASHITDNGYVPEYDEPFPDYQADCFNYEDYPDNES